MLEGREPVEVRAAGGAVAGRRSLLAERFVRSRGASPREALSDSHLKRN